MDQAIKGQCVWPRPRGRAGHVSQPFPNKPPTLTSLEPFNKPCKPHLLQEPTNQAMRVTVFDHDFSGGPDILGRCLVKLAPVCAKEMTDVVNWSYLGPGSWSDPAGCVSTCVVGV